MIVRVHQVHFTGVLFCSPQYDNQKFFQESKNLYVLLGHLCLYLAIQNNGFTILVLATVLDGQYNIHPSLVYSL